MEIGDKILMEGERQRYAVQAFDDRFVIMTKPFNAQRTYLYTIADRKRLVRGPINLIFGLPSDVNSPESAKVVLGMMNAEKWEPSHRKSVDLEPSEISQLWPE